jgi:predicted ATPase/DNA-binding winged helix-turn-helix (wHTH) protein
MTRDLEMDKEAKAGQARQGGQETVIPTERSTQEYVELSHFAALPKVDQAPHTIYAFGDFRLDASCRTLERNGSTVVIGDRALDLLIALVERADQVVGVRELMSIVWAGLRVEENNVRVQLTALRRALGDSEGSRFISNVQGRGYRFVHSFRTSQDRIIRPAGRADSESFKLPPPLSRMIGRHAEVAGIRAALGNHRWVTVVGPGGVGKTTVAKAVAHELAPAFADSIYFFDLAALGDERLVAGTVASALGLESGGQGPVAAIINYLRDGRVMFVLDSCEHLIESLAKFAESLFAGAPGVRILATSREAMRAEGEYVYPLAGLSLPPLEAISTAAEISQFAAVQLFLERVQASLGPFTFTDSEAPIVASICQRLDGLALAIELAAARVGSFGLEGITAELDNQLTMSWPGRRTAPFRHQTLGAMLDWSYRLLALPEQKILRSLAVVAGEVTADAAVALCTTNSYSVEIVHAGIASLVGKSLIHPVTHGASMRYRLLDTTRAYLKERLYKDNDYNAVAEAHARYYHGALIEADAASDDSLRTVVLAGTGDYLANIRLALEWSFSLSDKKDLAAALARLAAPVFLELSLYTECAYWARRGLTLINREPTESQAEAELQLCHGWSLMATNGNSEEARGALARATQISESLGLPYQTFRALGLLHMQVQRMGHVDEALALAEKAAALAKGLPSTAHRVLAEWLLGLSRHFAGDQAEAARCCESARHPSMTAEAISRLHFGYDHRIRAASTLSRALWLSGFLDQARDVAVALDDDTADRGHTASICFYLVWTTPMFIEFGEYDVPNRLINKLRNIAGRHSLKPYLWIGLAWKGWLTAREGDYSKGASMMEEAVDGLRYDRYDVLVPRILSLSAEVLFGAGQFQAASHRIDHAIVEAKRFDDRVHMADILRIKGDIVGTGPVPDARSASKYYLDALKIAHDQAALIWQLRAQAGLVKLGDQWRTPRELDKLEQLYGAFEEGFDSQDLIAVRGLLQARGGPPLASRQ